MCVCIVKWFPWSSYLTCTSPHLAAYALLFFFGETSFCLIDCALFHSGCRPYGALPEMFIHQVTASCPKPTWKYHLALKASLLWRFPGGPFSQCPGAAINSPAGWVTWTRRLSSQFWRPDVPGQGVSRAGSFWDGEGASVRGFPPVVLSVSRGPACTRTPVRLRQELDRPQAEGPEFLPCGQTCQSIVREESWGLSREERDHISLLFKVRETSLTAHARKGSLEVQKGGGLPSTVSDVNLPTGLFAEIYLDWEMLLHVGGPKDKPSMDSEPGKARWFAKGNPGEMPP